MKHLVTFLLGAAAGVAAYKYSTMTTEEREEFISNLKAKAGKLKDDAESAMHKAKDYFEELKEKTAEHMNNAEKRVKDMFGQGETAV